ncbi:MAG: sulfurtransferase TusA family protein [Chloroflexi bacterium]|nr:sulfurtransferase TusA family protein [Chloroflexota bacterium]
MVADMTLDCTGLICPMPIVKMAKAIKQIEQGQVLQLIATDPGSPADVEAWSRQTGHELLDSEEEGNRYVFFLRRSK